MIPVNESLLQFSPPVTPIDNYISLENSLVYENDKDRHIFRHCVLCWTVQSALPQWVELSQQLLEVRAFGKAQVCI